MLWCRLYFRKIPKELLGAIALEDDSIQAAKAATIEQGECIIELLPLIKDFFKLQILSNVYSRMELCNTVILISSMSTSNLDRIAKNGPGRNRTCIETCATALNLKAII